MIAFNKGLLGNTAGPNLNSLGHRCVEIAELNFQKYFLFVGDQINLGFDISLENTYPYLLSKRLGHSYYNLSVFNGGADAIKHNLITWMFRYSENKPKAIFIAAEFLNSFLISDKNLSYIDPADYNNDVIKDASTFANNNGFFIGRNFILEKLIVNNINVPIYYLNIEYKTKLFYDKVYTIEYREDITDQKLLFNAFLQKFNSNTVQLRP